MDDQQWHAHSSCKMWLIPSVYQKFLAQEGLMDYIYNAMLNKDSAEVVIVALEILRKTNQLLRPYAKELKSDLKSKEYRIQGNNKYKTGNYQIALEYYNKALLYAPEHSTTMLLAYSNRSALLFTIQKFAACLCDINICLCYDCPPDLSEKLNNRKTEANNHLLADNLRTRLNRFCDEYFLISNLHPQISSASTDIGVTMEEKIPKLVAAKEIKVGTIVAKEHAFVSRANVQLLNKACYYCHKITFNLIPCDGCCVALFCDIKCKSSCMADYHNVECNIIGVLQLLEKKFPLLILAVRAAIQMRSRCKSWAELITQSQKVGKERIKESEIKEIYDIMNVYSMLNTMDDSVFVYGNMYNLSFALAIILYNLSEDTSFFPDDLEERRAAQRGFCRVAMFLSLHGTPRKISSVVSIMTHDTTELCTMANFGFFVLTGKLKHACNPNLLAVGLNNQIALVAVQPIKPGTELTISAIFYYGRCMARMYCDVIVHIGFVSLTINLKLSYFVTDFDKQFYIVDGRGHWYDNHVVDTHLRRKLLYQLNNIACECNICLGDWLHPKEANLTEMQKKLLCRLDIPGAVVSIRAKDYTRLDDIYKKSAKTLAMLSDLPYSKEYKLVYRLFRKCIIELQNMYSRNILINKSS